VNQTLLRLLVCLTPAATAIVPVMAQQVPPSLSAGSRSATTRTSRPAAVQTRPVPRLAEAVERSLSGPRVSMRRLREYETPARPSTGVPPGGAVDPITGLPLHLISRLPPTGSGQDGQSPGPEAAQIAAPALRSAQIPGPVSPLPFPSKPQVPVKRTRPPVTLLPPLPQKLRDLPQPAFPNSPAPVRLRSPQTSSPIDFDGWIEPLSHDRAVSGDFDWGSLDAPIPQIDPPLPQFGNADGSLDMYDILEEFSGRATHSGIPDNPHLTHPDQRSWLRIEDWRTEVSWLAGTGDQLGISTARGSIGIGLAKIKGLVLRPTFASYWLNGPRQTDLPAQVSDAELEVTWMHRFNDRFRMHVSGKGGIYSDFNTSDDFEEALRVSGTGIGALEVHPDLQIVLGVAYFNLGSVWMWPVAGVVYQPDEELRLELLFPEGRISAVINKTDVFTERLYVGGRFFGRTWQVDRTNGMRERVTYSDWRIATGREIRYIYGITTFLEFGYAFHRELEYRSGFGNSDPQGVAMFSGGLYY